MVERTAARAARYIWESMTDDDVLTLEFCWESVQRVPDVPADIRDYLFGMNQRIEQFENFLHRRPFMFFVENGRLARNDPNFHSARRKAVDYFRGILDDYEEPAYYTNLRGHVGQAEEEVIDFLNTFYPKESFILFFESYPDNFVVFQDDTVLSVEDDVEEENEDDSEDENADDFSDESVRYFKDVLENFGDGQYFMTVRGHIGQAPPDVIHYINFNFPGESFLDFLNDNNDVFEVREGDVFLR